jgi:hypothetical protein
VLERALTAVEQRGLRDEAALEELTSIVRSSPPVSNSTSADNLPPVCQRRARAERAGTWSLLPFLAARNSGQVYVRDLHERNTALFRRFSGPFYIVRPDSAVGPRRPHLVPLDVDSAQWEWTIQNGRLSNH